MNNEQPNNPLSYTRLAGTYEEYFQKQKFVNLKPDGFEVSGPYSTERFIHQYHEFMRSFQVRLFSDLMRMEWADRKVWYNGKNKHSSRSGKISGYLNTALKFFYEHYIGFSRRSFTYGLFRAIRSYADDLFPDFEDRDGFADEFSYPYRYMSMEALHFVYLLPERMELLAEGEKHRLTLLQFYDYVSAYSTEQRLLGKKNYNVYYYENSRGLPYMNEQLSFVERMKRQMERKSK